MPNFASATIIGHAGRDAETKYLSGGDAVVDLSVAVSKKRKDKEATTWWKVTIFGKPAEWAGSIKKGDVVFAQGAPEIEEWTDKDGAQRQTLKLLANSITGFGKWQKAESAPASASKNDNEMPDDDIPF